MTIAEPLLSPDWYRIAYLTPRLRGGIEVSQHRIRGEQWYVLTDTVAARHFRFNEQAYLLIAACDGKASIDEVWSSCVESQPDSTLTQAEVIRILAQAFAGNLFVGNLEPDIDTIVGEQHKRARKRRVAALNPLAFRIPLWDPDAMLTRSIDRVAWLLSKPAQWVMLTMIAVSSGLLVLNASAFADFAAAQLGTGSMLLMLWFVFPVVKGLHELAHAYSIKTLGGQVHEIGLTLMMLTPMPYVDASASIAFPRKQDRIRVAAAGILVEAFIASLALPLWLLLEPSLLRELAFAFVFAGALSTLLINGNPLLRFDGYYVFCDLIETPNLGTRSATYWQSLLKRKLLRLDRARFGRLLRGEQKWLLAYAPLSWLYRVSLILVLCLVVAEWSAWLGILMLAFGSWMLFGKPIWRTVHWLMTSGELHGHRWRAQWITAGVFLLVFGLAMSLPVPNRTYASAIVWLPEDAILRAESDGVFDQFLAQDQQLVTAGTAIAVLSNDRLQTELARLESDLDAQRVEQARQFRDDAEGSLTAREGYFVLLAERDLLAKKVDRLTVRALSDGYLAVRPGEISTGQYLPQGSVIARVMPRTGTTVRALVRNEDVALVREQTEKVSVQLPFSGMSVLPATLTHVTPKASRELPSAALSMQAGGSIAVQADGKDELAVKVPRFAFDLALDKATPTPVGARAMAVFDHGSTTVIGLFGRFFRQSFLRHFST